MPQELISIITPCYNGHHYISDTLQSVLAQSYANWELLIIDDHSDDETLSLVKEIANGDPRIHIFGLPKNAGVANARNIGLQHAKGRYIAFLDSDDVWLADKLKVQLAFMHASGSAISFTAFRKIDLSGAMISGVYEVPNEVNHKKLLTNNVIACSSAMYDRKQLSALRFPDVGHEDFAFWLQGLKTVGLAQGLNEVLLHYRVRKGSVSSNKWQAAGFTWRVYRDVERMHVWQALTYFVRYAYYAIKKRV